MKTYAFSSTMFVEAENGEEATQIFKEQANDFVREAEMEVI